MKFDAEVGDVVMRQLAGVIPMELFVTEVTESRIICGAWEFSRDTGLEIDDFIPVTVSFISEIVKRGKE